MNRVSVSRLERDDVDTVARVKLTYCLHYSRTNIVAHFVYWLNDTKAGKVFLAGLFWEGHLWIEGSRPRSSFLYLDKRWLCCSSRLIIIIDDWLDSHSPPPCSHFFFPIAHLKRERMSMNQSTPFHRVSLALLHWTMSTMSPVSLTIHYTGSSTSIVTNIHQ